MTARRIFLSFALALVLALGGIAIVQVYDPDAFGPCFEGACGYVAMLVAIPTTLVLTPILWLALRRIGPLSEGLLGFVLFAIIGYVILWVGWWLLGLIAIGFAMWRLVQRFQAEGRPTRDLFVMPRSGTPSPRSVAALHPPRDTPPGRR